MSPGLLIPERALSIARRTREAHSRQHGRLHHLRCGSTPIAAFAAMRNPRMRRGLTGALTIKRRVARVSKQEYPGRFRLPFFTLSSPVPGWPPLRRTPGRPYVLWRDFRRLSIDLDQIRIDAGQRTGNPSARQGGHSVRERDIHHSG